MRFVRAAFDADGEAADAVRLCEGLRPGRWLVEAGCRPPRAHHPALLLGRRRALLGGVAISLRSATLLGIDLGVALAGRLEADVCELGPIVGLALHELLLNAAIHGNLEVASGRAAKWHDLATRSAAIAMALDDPSRAARLVTVAIGWSAEAVATLVADEGKGYTPSPPNARTDDSRPRAAGRGLLIAGAAGRLRVLRNGRCARLTIPREPALVTS
jgi:hypothetical protein